MAYQRSCYRLGTSLVGPCFTTGDVLAHCTNPCDGCAKAGVPMNLGRLLTGIALRQIDVAAAETDLRSLDHTCVGRYKYPYNHKPPENFYANSHGG